MTTTTTLLHAAFRSAADNLGYVGDGDDREDARCYTVDDADDRLRSFDDTATATTRTNMNAQRASPSLSFSLPSSLALAAPLLLFLVSPLVCSLSLSRSFPEHGLEVYAIIFSSGDHASHADTTHDRVSLSLSTDDAASRDARTNDAAHEFDEVRLP